MFENLVNQEAGKQIISDIKHNRLPGAVLYAGPEASGKLTAALETARILSCHENPQGIRRRLRQ
jgi:DNA polymerase-3 subunit gamma/tau